MIFRMSIIAIFVASTFFLAARYYAWDEGEYYTYISIGVIALEYFFTSLGQAIVFTYPIEAFPTS